MESNDESLKEITVNEKEVPQQSSDDSLPDKGLNTDVQTESASEDSKAISDGSDSPTVAKSRASDDRYFYSKDELIAISKLSLARIRPKCLDNAFNNEKNGLWNPEKWISSRSPSGSLSANKYKRDDKKANNDLKERVLEEGNDDIILSPQRGSFGTGCHVSTTSFGPTRGNESRSRDHFMERNKSEESNDGSNRSASSRRIGTGRVIPRDRDRPNDWSERNYDRNGRDSRDNRDARDNRNEDFNDRRNGRNDRRFDRYDRKSNRNRYDNDRYGYRNSRDEEEEPEWFTEGPTNPRQYIELRGFDDDSESSKDGKESLDMSEDVKTGDKDTKPMLQRPDESDKKAKTDTNADKNDEFDVNAWLKTDDWFGDESQMADNKMISSLDGISNNIDKECDTNTRSRFKRWFQDNPNQSVNSMATDFNSHRTDTFMNNNQMRELPISTAVPLNTQMPNVVSPEKKILELLKGSNRVSGDQLMGQPKIDTTKMMNLAEIEANLPNVSTQATNQNKVLDKLFSDPNRKSAQTPGRSDRVQNFHDFKGDSTIFQTQNSNLVVPKGQQTAAAPSILDMLREEENKEAIVAMADLHRNNRVLMNEAMIRANANAMTGSASQSTPPSHPFAAQMMNNGANHMSPQNWQNTSPLMKVIRPQNRHNIANTDMSDQTNLLLQSAILRRHPQPEVSHRSPSLNNSSANSSPARSMPNANFFTPTSVMRNMHSDKEKTATPFNEMTSESNSSQHKFLNDMVLPKPSSMRPIIKSNNPIGQSMTVNKAVIQSPIASHSDHMSYGISSELAGHESQLLQHQLIHQSASPSKSYQRPVANQSVRPFAIDQSQMGHNSALSPNQMSRNVLRMLQNQSNVRPNASPMSINQMMALQHNSSDGRQPQYLQSRPITASNLPQMFNKSDPFGQFDRDVMQESEVMRSSLATTYSPVGVGAQSRQAMQRPMMSHSHSQVMNQGPSQMNRAILGQIFGEEKLMRQSLSEMPAVPLKNALTLEDLERV